MTVVWTIVAIVVIVLVLKAKYGATGLGSATCRHCGAPTASGRAICPSCGRDRTVLNPKRARKH